MQVYCGQGTCWCPCLYKQEFFTSKTSQKGCAISRAAATERKPGFQWEMHWWLCTTTLSDPQCLRTGQHMHSSKFIFFNALYVVWLTQVPCDAREVLCIFCFIYGHNVTSSMLLFPSTITTVTPYISVSEINPLPTVSPKCRCSASSSFKLQCHYSN